MFEVVHNMYNDKVVIKSIKYKQSYIKQTFKGFMILILGFFGLSLISLVFHFANSECPLFLSIIFGIVAVIFIPIFIVTYKDIKSFSLDFNEDGISFRCRKVAITINYYDLKVCGQIRRAGSKEWGDIVLNQPSNHTDQKNMFVFTSEPNPNFEKIVWHMRTSTGVCHGYIKNILCISDYRSSPIFSKCFETIDCYCSDFSVEIINKDRQEL